jgi:uncharacterized protein
MIKKLWNFLKKNNIEYQDKQISLRVAGISYSKVANIYVLILEETIASWNDPNNPPPTARRVPIIINFFEAQVIAIEIERIKPDMILVYDVIKNLANAFKFSFDRIVIYSISDSEICAKLICKNKEKTVIDIKPSDAIAISIRLKIPIIINDRLLTSINDMLNEKYDVKRMSEMEKLENYSIQDLKKFLQDAIDREDYENASLIRDEIGRKSKVE